MPKAKPKSAKQAEPIYVVTGKNDALVSKKCHQLLDEIIAHDQRSAGLLTLDGDKATASEVFDELRTLPFLADTRVVVVKDADKFVTNNRPLLEKYFDKPCTTGTLILTLSTWQSTTKLAKKLPKTGLLKVEDPSRAQLPPQLTAYAKQEHNKTLSAQAANLLIELSGDDIITLETEIDKLALFAADNPAITSAHIEELVGANRFFNVFSVIDAILEADPGKAVSRLRKMFEDDKSAEYTVVGAFAYQFRKMFQAKAMLNTGVNQYETAKNLAIWGDREGFFRQLAKLTLPQIGNTIQWLAETDYEIKTGQTESKVAIEQLVLKLATK